MLKDEFLEEIESVDDRIKISMRSYMAYVNHIKSGFRGFSVDNLRIDLETETKYTKTNLQKIKEEIEKNKEKIDEWHEEWKRYSKTAEYIRRKRKDEMKDLALEAGLEHNPGSYDRGNYHYLSVVDFVYKKKDLEKYHATGELLGVVNMTRKRVYAKSSRWSPSERDFKYLVGRNENGNAFAHPIPNHIQNLDQAVKWIWDDNVIEARQGDVAITDAPHLKNPATAKEDNKKIVDAHRVEGEIYENGAIYCRNARIYHEKDQHEEIEIGDEWKRILVAKESQNDENNKTED